MTVDYCGESHSAGHPLCSGQCPIDSVHRSDVAFWSLPEPLEFGCQPRVWEVYAQNPAPTSPVPTSSCALSRVSRCSTSQGILPSDLLLLEPNTGHKAASSLRLLQAAAPFPSPGHTAGQ